MNDVTLVVPARPDFLHLVRLVVSGVAARRGLSYDEIDDLRIAVSEAAGYVTQIPAPFGRLFLRMDSTPDVVEAVICTDAHVTEWPPPGVEQGLAWRVLSGLADEVTFFRWDDKSPAVRLVKRIRRAEGR